MLAGFLLGFSCLMPMTAQAETNPLAESRFVTVGDERSMSDGVVSAIAQDAAGFIWVGASEGLMRYDGYQFRPFFLSTDGKAETRTGFVRGIAAAPDGSLWLATEGDTLIHIHPADNSWVGYRHNPAKPASLAPGTLRALALEADGSIWVGTTGGGLDRFDPATQRFEHHRRDNAGLPDDRIQSLFIDRRGNLWVGTWNGLARRSRGSTRFEAAFPNQGDDANLKGKIVSMIGEDATGRIWVGTQQGDLMMIDPVSGTAAMLAPGPADSDGKQRSVYAMTTVGTDEIWIARASGLELRSTKDGSLIRMLRHDLRKPWGLAGDDVRVLLRDRAGSIWVGGYGGGLQVTSPPRDSMWVRRADVAEDSVFGEADVRSLLQLKNGDIWVGTGNRGVAVMDDKLRVLHAIRPVAQGQTGFRGGRVSGMAQTSDGNVWLGTDNAVYEFTPQRRLVSQHSAGKGRVRRMLAGADGRLWVGTQDGVYLYAPGAAGMRRIAQVDGKPLQGDVNALQEGPDQSIWVAGKHGLFRIAPGDDRLQMIGARPGEGLDNQTVLGMLFDRRNVLWVETSAGLFRMQSFANADARFFRVYDAQRHGGRAFGANLLADARGRLWTHRAIYDPDSGSYDELGLADGADIGTGWFRSYTQLADGRMLFGGNKGMLVVDPEKFARWAFQPPLVVSELRINGELSSAADLQKGLRLTRENRRFSIEFAALDFTNPVNNRYSYQLEGFDQNWIKAGADLRVASYNNLDPGKYILRVRGSNRVRDWSPNELMIPIEILPAWWQTWWSSLLALGLLWLFFYGLIQWRTRFLLRQQASLETKVRERTEELEALSTALHEKSLALEESSLTDPLTGMHNRRFLTQHIEIDVAQSIRLHESSRQNKLPPPDDADLIFFLIDIDHFKQVNDDYGHSAGDAVIVQMRACLQAVFRDSDYLVRWGGEEFLIVARRTARLHAAELAERARTMVANHPFVLPDGTLLHRTCTVGFAAFPLAREHARALDWSAVVGVADAALYVVKREGRDGWLGVLSAQGDSPDSLRAWARRPMREWLATGAVEVVGLRPDYGKKDLGEASTTAVD